MCNLQGPTQSNLWIFVTTILVIIAPKVSGLTADLICMACTAYILGTDYRKR